MTKATKYYVLACEDCNMKVMWPAFHTTIWPDYHTTIVVCGSARDAAIAHAIDALREEKSECDGETVTVFAGEQEDGSDARQFVVTLKVIHEYACEEVQA